MKDAEFRALVAQGPAVVMVAKDDMLKLLNERDDLRRAVVAYGILWMVPYAREHGLPPGYLHPQHYDELERAGARMDSFKRQESKA